MKLEQEIKIEWIDKSADEVLSTLGITDDIFSFNKIRPMGTELNLSEYVETIYGESSRTLYLNSLLEGKYPDTNNIYTSNANILKLISEEDHLSIISGATRMAYDNVIALARRDIRRLPLNGNDDALHKYGYQSNDTSYLFNTDNEIDLKCQADALLFGKLTLMNLIKYGAYTKKEWVEKNWGCDDPIDASLTKTEDLITIKFSGYSTIIPLLNYSVKLLELIKTKITYTYGTEDNMVTLVKPYDSKYFIEV
jgi:hypothetical protein